VPTTSIVVPTYNEAANIETLLDRIEAAMAGRGPNGSYEIVVVDDDSADGTWRLVEERSHRDERIRVLRRVGQRGLSSAVLAGMAMARGDVLVVIDADLQHDERRIPDLVEAVRGGADVALGSREAEGGGYGPFARRRLLASRLGAAVARLTIGVEVTDPMSGFFAVSRERHRELSGRINPRGFKILLEFLARGREPRIEEVGYVFGARVAGSTKLSGSVVVAFVVSLVELAVTRRIDRRRAGARASDGPAGDGQRAVDELRPGDR
jgi:dolichol-phosphate mannosyltransferase